MGGLARGGGGVSFGGELGEPWVDDGFGAESAGELARGRELELRGLKRGGELYMGFSSEGLYGEGRLPDGRFSLGLFPIERISDGRCSVV